MFLSSPWASSCFLERRHLWKLLVSSTAVIVQYILLNNATFSSWIIGIFYATTTPKLWVGYLPSQAATPLAISLYSCRSGETGDRGV